MSMSKAKPTRSRGELLVCVQAELKRYPDSKELRKSQAKLIQSFSMEKKLYILPIVGAAAALFGAWLSISDGSIEPFVGMGVIGLLVALAFFPARLLYRWELGKALRKIEKVLAELPDTDA